MYVKDNLHIIFQTNDIDICRRPYTFKYKVLKLHHYSLPVWGHSATKDLWQVKSGRSSCFKPV